ncbi:hypothetical protein [Streptomyces sp. NRRL S-475]|uniref:hypothetical protein n=1 Tax=Streptomyces sp. NRRL S-475 TaxID=1463910 RepID=UPI001F3A118C|nr:hypothetical protein [Streptomyces sp. NRRL S-475]
MSDDRPVLLPSSVEWSEEARLVGEALRTVQAAASAAGDEERYLLPPLLWQIAADRVEDCPTVDHGYENLRIMVVPEYALRAVRDCHGAFVRARDGDVEAARLADLLSRYLHACDTDLYGLVACLERVLAVLCLGIAAVRTLATHLALNQGDAPEAVHAVTEVLTAWRKAGVAP